MQIQIELYQMKIKYKNINKNMKMKYFKEINTEKINNNKNLIINIKIQDKIKIYKKNIGFYKKVKENFQTMMDVHYKKQFN